MPSAIKPKLGQRLDSFITVKRQVKSDYLNNLITRNELMLLLWLRLCADPYGVATTSIAALNQDIFPDVQANYVQKMLLSLRSKKYVYYANRQGSRGSFEIHLDDWIMPNGSIKHLGPLFGDKAVTTLESPKTQSKAEPPQSIAYVNPKLQAMKSQLSSALSSTDRKPLVTTTYKDTYTDTDKDIDIIDNQNFSSNTAKILVSGYQSNNADEYRCHEIALKLGESHMDFLLSVLENHGIDLINRALGIYKEQVLISSIQNPPAYFNKIIHQLIEESAAQK